MHVNERVCMCPYGLVLGCLDSIVPQAQGQRLLGGRHLGISGSFITRQETHWYKKKKKIIPLAKHTSEAIKGMVENIYFHHE